MEKDFYTGNQDFVKFIKYIGFTYQNVYHSKNLYFKNKFGKQIKVNLRNQTITFLDKAGNLIYKSNKVSKKQIEEFCK